MRENDDDAPEQGSDGGRLADGLGETVRPGDYSSGSEPYGDGAIDDADSTADGDHGDDTGHTSDDVVIYDDTDDTETDADDTSTGDGYGDGEVVIYEEVDDAHDSDVDETEAPDASFDASEVLAEDASPLQGIGFLLDEVRDALFGDEDEAISLAFDPDPVDLETDTDLDLTGDGVVDTADLVEAGSVLDFEVDHGGHEGV